MYRAPWLLALTPLLLAACSSSGPSLPEIVDIETDPPGVRASLSNGAQCTTPCALRPPVDGMFRVNLKKTGYQSKSIWVNAEDTQVQGRMAADGRFAGTGEAKRTSDGPEIVYAQLERNAMPNESMFVEADPEAENKTVAENSIMDNPAGSDELDAKRAAVRGSFGVRLGGYEKAGVEMTPFPNSRSNDQAVETADADEVETAILNDITAEDASKEATGALMGGTNAVQTPSLPVTRAQPIQPEPSAAVTPIEPEDIQIAAVAPQEPVAQLAGTAGVQLVSTPDRASAEVEAEKFRAQHGELLAGLRTDVQEADLGERGIYYRVRFVGLANKDEAHLICSQLDDQGQACLAVTR